MRKNHSYAETNQRSSVIRWLVSAQIAVQAGMAILPFWTSTVQASLLDGGAQQVSGLAQAQQSGNVNGYLSQQAAGATSAQIQQWLQNFGTARVELETNSHFKPHTGGIDLLLPLYKSEERPASA